MKLLNLDQGDLTLPEKRYARFSFYGVIIVIALVLILVTSTYDHSMLMVVGVFVLFGLGSVLLVKKCKTKEEELDKLKRVGLYETTEFKKHGT